jgi:hypothetical protein
MPAKLIALYSSRPQMGKSTVAEYLSGPALWPVPFQRVKFAAPLKAMVSQLLVFTGLHPDYLQAYLEGSHKEVPIPCLGVTTRKLLQTLGTDWGRKMISDDMWINLAKVQIEKYLKMGRNVVVDDMRFPNEYDLIKSLGGYCVKVERPYIDGITSPHEIEVCSHSSEGQLDHIWFDDVISAPEGIENLQAETSKVIGRLYGN